MASPVIELNLSGNGVLRRDLTVSRLADDLFSVSVWLPLALQKVAFATASSIELTWRTRKCLLLHVGEASFDVTWVEARHIADRFGLPFPVSPAPVEASSLPSPRASAVAGAFSRT